jgi:methyl-accepting chemotaxis protein
VAGASDQATSIKHAALALSLGVGARVLLASWALGGGVLRPVQLVADRATRIAQGDLRPLAIAKTTDEPGEGGGDGGDGGERGSGSLGHPARDRRERN